MLAILKKQWFLVALVALIAIGLALGSSLDSATVTTLKGLIPPRVVTTIVLFLMAFSLDSGHLKQSLRSPKPVLFGSLVNFGLIPMLVWVLLSVQSSDDFKI